MQPPELVQFVIQNFLMAIHCLYDVHTPPIGMKGGDVLCAELLHEGFSKSSLDWAWHPDTHYKREAA